ncbi:MAG: aminopeptidase N, partial [Burkholderiaceae bacterium]
MRTEPPVTIQRADYRAPGHWIEHVDLEFDLAPASTLVTAKLAVRRHPQSQADELVLDGEDLELVSLTLDGKAITPGRYWLRDGKLIINGMPARAELVVVNRIHPAANTQLSGLYVSNGNFFTQCEAEGFRRITFFPDRPDVMARYRVTLRADRAHYPVLLSNGNLVAEGELADGRHFARWEDPFPKP